MTTSRLLAVIPFIEHAPLSSAKAKLVKLGDKIAHVRRGTNPELERYYDEALASAQAALEA